MRESICNVFHPEQSNQDIRIAHFVYEIQWQKLPQPFLPLIHYIHIVTSGTATLRELDREYPLCKGSIFFMFPGRQYYLNASADFCYIYISFMGAGVASLMEQMQISPRYPVYNGYSRLCEMFMTTVESSRPQNVSVLANGLLLYTLGHLHSDATAENRKPKQVFANVVDYVDEHFTDPDLSLKELARISSYTEKYLSSLFIKNMEVSFLQYLTNLRIQRAMVYLSYPMYTVAQVAQLCGYKDPLYFSKVFKKHTGLPPTQYKEERAKTME